MASTRLGALPWADAATTPRSFTNAMASWAVKGTRSDHTAVTLAIRPVASKKTKHLDVLRFALRHPTLTQQALLREAESFEQTRRRPVARIDLGFQAAQAQRAERAADKSFERFSHETSAPEDAPQNVAQFCPRAAFFEPEQKAGADCQSGRLEHHHELKSEPGCLNA